MEKEQIRGKINYYNNLTMEYMSEKSKLEQQIQELKSLNGKLGHLQSEFISKQTSIRSGLACLFNVNNSINAIIKYCSGMYDLLNGCEYTNVKNGIGTAKSEVNTKKRELERMLDSINWKIKNCQNSLGYWEYQLKTYKEPED